MTILHCFTADAASCTAHHVDDRMGNLKGILCCGAWKVAFLLLSGGPMILPCLVLLFKLKSTIRLAASLGAITCVLSGAGFAADGGALTLTEAQALAVGRSRQLPAQDFAVAASRDLAVAAGRLPDPLLRIGLDNLPITGPDRFSIGNDFMTMRRVGISQEITRTEKRQLRADRFEREADKSIAEKTAILAVIQRDTALAWLERYYAEAMAAVVAEQARQARLEIEAALDLGTPVAECGYLG